MQEVMRFIQKPHTMQITMLILMDYLAGGKKYMVQTLNLL